MTFLYNAWYCAGWAADLTDAPIAITILNEPVLLYRKVDGAAVAIGNRCPHRFAPLHLGKRVGDDIQCTYHGLRFGPDGTCTHSPYGPAPRAASVKCYPLVERHDAMWVWMGNAELADPDQIVDVSAISQQAGWAQIHGQLKINAHYELVSDNLMDLSHVQYLHPFLSFDGPPPPDFEVKIGMRQEGEYVYQDNLLLNTPSAPIFKALWGEEKVDIGTMRSHMRWSPPSNLLLDVGMIRPGGSEADGVCIPTAHLLTPETEKSTHYFWAQNRNRHVDDDAFSKQMHAGITDVFINEDEWMIEACQKMMGSTDLLSLKPVLLPGDAAAMRARRVLAARLQEEQIDTHGSSLIGRSSS